MLPMCPVWTLILLERVGVLLRDSLFRLSSSNPDPEAECRGVDIVSQGLHLKDRIGRLIARLVWSTPLRTAPAAS